MNLSVLLGFLLGGGIIYFVTSSGIQNPQIFFSPHAALIVVGGTCAAAFICFPFSYFVNMFRVFFVTMTGRRRAATHRTIIEIVRISEALKAGRPLSSEIPAIQNPFLKEMLELMEEGGLSDSELDEVMDKRIEIQNENYKRNGFTFRVIGKFPPAFGLVGTTVGMIMLLQGLGGQNSFERIGPAMAMALVATFYGLVLANFFLIPVAENLSQASDDDLLMRRIVVDGVRLIKAEKHPLLVSEYLKSYLMPAERAKMATATA